MAAADIAGFTPSNIIIYDRCRTLSAQWAVGSMAKGKWVYRNDAGKYDLADANDTAIKAECAGMIIDEGTGAADTWGTIATAGKIDFGTSTTGMSNKRSVLLSANPGNAMEETTDNIATITTGDFHCHLGVAQSDRILEIAITYHQTAVT